MDHQQLATCMVCSWGFVKAYQWTRQNVYICLPAPHVLEAYNEQFYKELNLQECAVLQYAHTLQYVSYCTDMRYKDRWAPIVKNFWAEVVEPFRSWALCNLDHPPSPGYCDVPKLGGPRFQIMGFGNT